MARWKQRLIREKIEVTYGTPVAPAATDAILAREVSYKALDADYTEQTFVNGREGAQAEDLSNVRSAISYQIEAAPPATAGQPPVYAHILRSSGLAMADDDGDTVFTPLSETAVVPSCTAQIRNGAMMQTIAGVRGSFGFTAEVGKRPYFSFDRLGIYADPVAFVPASHDFSGWPRALECNPENMFAFTLGGTKLCITRFNFTDGRKPTPNRYMNCDGTLLGPRRYTGSMTVKHPDIATKDLIAMVRASAAEPLIFTLGKTAGSILTVTGRKTQIKAPAEQDIDGDLGLSLDLIFLPDAGDDEVEIRFS